MPKISVITACYNGSAFIEQAINSVLNQTFMDFELIIVDDASTDNSLALAQTLASHDSRIKVISMTQQSGPSAARNFAIQEAQGEWLAILDADDRFTEVKLQEQLEWIKEKNTNIVLIGSNSYDINAQGERVRIQRYSSNSLELKAAVINASRFPVHSSLMYHAAAVRSVGGFNERFLRSGDSDLKYRLLGKGEMASVPRELVEYRIHAGNISRADADVRMATYRVAARVSYFLRERGCVDPSMAELNGEWTAFLAWVERRLNTLGAFEVWRAQTDAQMEWRVNPNRILGILRALRRLFAFSSLPYLRHTLVRRWPLEEKLAEEWDAQARNMGSRRYVDVPPT